MDFDQKSIEDDLNRLEAGAIPCFRKANKSDYAAGLRIGKHSTSCVSQRRTVDLICTWIPGPRQNLITRGTYKNLTEEFLTEEYLAWSKKTMPTLKIGTLPRPKLHSGIFCTVHFHTEPSTLGRLDRPLSPRPIIRSHFEFHF